MIDKIMGKVCAWLLILPLISVVVGAEVILVIRVLRVLAKIAGLI